MLAASCIAPVVAQLLVWSVATPWPELREFPGPGMGSSHMSEVDPDQGQVGIIDWPFLLQIAGMCILWACTALASLFLARWIQPVLDAPHAWVYSKLPWMRAQHTACLRRPTAGVRAADGNRPGRDSNEYTSASQSAGVLTESMRQPSGWSDYLDRDANILRHLCR